MKTTKVVSVNIVGDRSGNPYTGDFTMKMLMTERDEFNADLRRRQILGPSPDGTPPAAALQWRAFMMGQLAARITDAPEWWLSSDTGMELADRNVVPAIYDAMLEAEEELAGEVKQETEKAVNKITKKKAASE